MTLIAKTINTVKRDTHWARAPLAMQHAGPSTGTTISHAWYTQNNSTIIRHRWYCQLSTAERFFPRFPKKMAAFMLLMVPPRYWLKKAKVMGENYRVAFLARRISSMADAKSGFTLHAEDSLFAEQMRDATALPFNNTYARCMKMILLRHWAFDRRVWNRVRYLCCRYYGSR